MKSAHRLGRLLHDLEFEVEFLAPKDGRKVELPEFSREAQRRPTLIKIDDELQPHSSPEIRQTYMSDERFELGGGVERKRRSTRNEASERVTIEVIAVSRIGGPIRIRIVRRNDLQSASGPRDAMQLSNEPKHVRHVLDHVTTNDLVEFIVGERIRKDAEIVNDVRMTARVRVNTDRAGKLILTTSDVQYWSCSRSGTIAVAHAISSYSKGVQPTLRC